MRFRTHSNPFQCLAKYGPIDWSEVFGHKVHEIDFEIGVGRGVFIRQYARKYPDRNIVGIEVRKNLAEHLNHILAEEGIRNVRIYYANAITFLEDSVTLPVIRRLFLFHPDPWPKSSHHKRRVIQPDVLALFSRKMLPDARLYYSTDNMELWQDSLPILSNSPHFEPVSEDPFWETDYTSHWHQFSIREGRQTQMSTWRK